MSLSTCSAYSVSAISRPARNAPSASDRPASEVRKLVPSATNNVVDAKISALANSDIFLYSGWMSVRPPMMIAVMHSTALTAAAPRACVRTRVARREGWAKWAAIGMYLCLHTCAQGPAHMRMRTCTHAFEGVHTCALGQPQSAYRVPRACSPRAAVIPARYGCAATPTYASALPLRPPPPSQRSVKRLRDLGNPRAPPLPSLPP
eukprot:365847-Chlamydomonas_euryale.AAC.4